MIMFKHFFICVIITGISVSAYSQSFNLKASIERGKEVYVLECQSCHMAEGEGLPGVYPPVAKTDYLKTANPLFNQYYLKRPNR